MPTVITYIMRIFSRGSPDDEGVKTVPLRSACQSLPGKVLRWTVPRPDEADPSHIGAESSTSRVDGGRDAWCFLLVCFIVEALVWGFPFAFGVFQDHYRTHELFANSSNIAVIGTCALGIMYFDTPFIMTLHRFFPNATRWAPTVGFLCMSLSLIASSFSETTTHLIITQGVLYALAGSICYCPCIVYLDEWFKERKGFAYGVMWAGTGAGGIGLPMLMEFLLGKYGFRTTLRIWAGCLLALTLPLVHFIKPRLPVVSHNTFACQSSGRESVDNTDKERGSKMDILTRMLHNPKATTKAIARGLGLGYVIQWNFNIYQVASTVESVGFFLPVIYLTIFAREFLGADASQAVIPIIVVNAASVVGLVLLGFLSDFVDVTSCLLISTAGTVLGTFLVWGFATRLPTLYLFCGLYGLFAGSYVAAWPRIMDDVVCSIGKAKQTVASPAPNNETDPDATTISTCPSESDDAAAGSSGAGGDNDWSSRKARCDRLMVFGFLAFGRGLGNVVSGPLSELLIAKNPWKDVTQGAFGSQYGLLIVLTGITALVGGLPWVCKRRGCGL